MIVDGFGLGSNARVQEDPTGTLGGLVAGMIANTGPDAVPAGYTVEVKIEAMTLHAVVGGTAEFVPRDTLFECMKRGMALAPGRQIGMDFDFGAGGCPL